MRISLNHWSVTICLNRGYTKRRFFLENSKIEIQPHSLLLLHSHHSKIKCWLLYSIATIWMFYLCYTKNQRLYESHLKSTVKRNRSEFVIEMGCVGIGLLKLGPKFGLMESFEFWRDYIQKERGRWKGYRGSKKLDF